ncbi:MAG: dTMP kinase [Leptospiraceae bacterium]|nr:dTMP kinase [Leptospiraceae bacterium]
MKYKFIVVEGFDGSGKSSIAKWLSEEWGYEFHKTPMGLFSSVRSHFDSEKIDLVERYCFYAADCMRASIYIKKQIESGKSIVLDRYHYSTIAYHESKMPGISNLLPDLFKPLFKPELVLYVKVNFQIANQRMAQRQNLPDDSLFLTQEYYDKIDQKFLSVFDVPYQVVDNSGRLEDTKAKVLNILQDKPKKEIPRINAPFVH